MPHSLIACECVYHTRQTTIDVATDRTTDTHHILATLAMVLGRRTNKHDLARRASLASSVLLVFFLASIRKPQALSVRPSMDERMRTKAIKNSESWTRALFFSLSFSLSANSIALPHPSRYLVHTFIVTILILPWRQSLWPLSGYLSVCARPTIATTPPFNCNLSQQSRRKLGALITIFFNPPTTPLHTPLKTSQLSVFV